MGKLTNKIIDEAVEELRLCCGNPRHGFDMDRAKKILQQLLQPERKKQKQHHEERKKRRDRI